MRRGLIHGGMIIDIFGLIFIRILQDVRKQYLAHMPQLGV
jgi:hypothetical protein